MRFSTASRFAFALFTLLLVVALFSAVPNTIHVALAAGNTWTVNSTADSGSTTCQANAGSGGPTCQLRDAISKVVNGDTINFSVTGTITVSLYSDAELTITHNITIQGPGAASLTISGNNSSRVFVVNSGSAVTFSGLTIANGHVNYLNGGGGYDGNAIYSQGLLTLNNCVFSSNGAGSYDYGGAVANDSGVLTVNNSTFVNNSAANNGGAVLNWGVLTVTNSTFTGNSASSGGAIYTNGTTTTISNSTFTGNSATYGGAIYNYDTSVTISNSTISGNTAVKAGGIDNNGYNGATLYIGSTIVAGNSAGTDPDTGNYVGTIASLGYNIVQTPGSTVTFNAVGDQTNVNPLLNALSDNGGPTQTMSLQAGSPAIRKGFCAWANTGATPPPPAVTTDQRGDTRKATCDVGAYETAAPPPTIDSIGIFRSGTFLLRLHNSTGYADISVAFTVSGKPYPIVGDWAGQGFDTVGVFNQNNGQFSLRNSNTPGTPDEQFTLGNPNDQPLSGKWTANATHAGAGVFRPSNGLIYLKNSLATGYADDTMVLGIPGDVGLAGDWSSKGYDSPGVYRPSNSSFYLSNQDCNCSVYADIQFAYGIGGDAPVAGDWVAQGHDGIGLFRQSNGYTYLKNTLTTGYADIPFVYGIAGDVPVAGHWQLTYPPKPNPDHIIVRPAAPTGSAANPPGSGLGD